AIRALVKKLIAAENPAKPLSDSKVVFLAIANELTATLLLAPNGTRTLATGFWALTSEIDYVAAAPYALIMVALSLPLTWLLYSQSKRTAGL
ncbi:iron ABC transporter permease, partial [Serratia marcescens]